MVASRSDLVARPPPNGPTLRGTDDIPLGGRHGRGGVVILATLGVPFDPKAAEVALDAAKEAVCLLIVTNVVPLEPLPISLQLGYYEPVQNPDVEAALRAEAERAQLLGIEVERVRIHSPHPLPALVEFAVERETGLLVFGPHRSRLRRRRYKRAARVLCERAPCLVWFAD